MPMVRPVFSGSTVFAALAITMASACSDGGSRPVALLSVEEETTTPSVEGCVPEGASRECFIPLPSHAGVANCARGVQECAASGWTPCHASKPDASAPDATEPEPFVPERDSNP